MAFPGEDAAETVRRIPALPGVFALYGAAGPDGVEPQPYLTRAADLRRRIARLLAPAGGRRGRRGGAVEAAESARAGGADCVDGDGVGVRVGAGAVPGGDGGVWGGGGAAAASAAYAVLSAVYGGEPVSAGVCDEPAEPSGRWTTTYGPFPSRAAAERYCDAVLDLFKLRRCWEELVPSPEHPGCIYGEIGKCLRPCQRAQEPEGAAEYSAEAAAVRRFFDTHGESMVVAIGLEREEASARDAV